MTLIAKKAVLLTLCRAGPMHPAELARRLETSERSLRRHLAALLVDGLIERDDGRLRLTENGEQDIVFQQPATSSPQPHDRHVIPSLKTPRPKVANAADRRGGSGGVSSFLSRVDQDQDGENYLTDDIRRTRARAANLAAAGPQPVAACLPIHPAGDEHTCQATIAKRAERMAKWMTDNIPDLRWTPAYTIGLAIAEGRWSQSEMFRVLVRGNRLRERGELRGPLWGYFVTACYNEISRENPGWRSRA